ncbi:hypothetical protein [uncultured Clostridium sp.]|uniref:hypothetical protein n=1 Tax=uncultured Clostridium sp. TaxID=59620 RepID=UPI0025FA67D5|nr:hypothetical protein [uncultured Clostridium sp.]
MELTLKEKLLNTTRLQDFQLILKKSNVKEIKELDKDVLQHFCRLGNGDCAYNHEDPRRK